MFPYNAKEGNIDIHGTSMRFVEFGYGEKPLVLLPGLVDGLKTVKGQAVNLAFYYRAFVKQFHIYVFSRKEVLEKGCTTKDMAADLKTALDSLGIKKAYLMGVSQGGMIAQHFAVNYPDMVEKLVLAVSTSRANDITLDVISKWMEWAQNNDYASLMVDTLEKTYSPKKLKTYRLVYPLIRRIGKPKDFSRFLVQADACRTHNTCHELHAIKCPTLILGGDSDQIVGADASPEMAEKITNAHLHIYEGLGHAAYEEAKDFNNRVMEFLQAKPNGGA